MTKILALMAIAYVTCCQVSVSLAQLAIDDDFPADFKTRAFQHIARLAEFGPRSPGADGEQQAFQYIRQQLENTGLEVQVEEFDYETFKIEEIYLAVCGEAIEAESIGFNPYGGPVVFDGEPVFVGPDVTGDEPNQVDLRDRIVITTSPVDYFGLLFQGPRLIVYINNSDFKRLAEKYCPSCSLAVRGTMETRSSANVIARFAPDSPADREVIVSAHWDSYRDSPGADDNGSGVGVLLELARFFSTFEGDIGGAITFVLFGVEELGVVGSRSYLNTHHQDLKDCILLFNIDRVGGPSGPAIEMLGGVQGIPERKGATQFPASIHNRTLEGLDGRWRIIDAGLIEAFMVTNRPVWLVEAIEASAEQLGINIRQAGNLGSDQQVFTQAGIVSTGIGTSGNQRHSSADIPAQIDKDSLEAVGKIVANVVLMSLRGCNQK